MLNAILRLKDIVMLIDRKHPFFGMVILKDANGETVRPVISWDSETKKTDVYLSVDNRILKMRIPSKHEFEWGLLYKTIDLPGSYLVYRKDGVRVTEQEIINGKRSK